MTLISPEALQDRLGDPDLRIADVRWWLNDRAKGRRDYAEAHLPGAVFVDLDADLAAPPGPGRHPLPSPAAFATPDGRARVRRRQHDRRLRRRGRDHRGAAVVDARRPRPRRRPPARRRDPGVDAIGGPLTARRAGAAGRAGCTLRDAGRGRSSGTTLEARLGDVALIDARAPERYRGEVEPVDGVAGHIPTAVNRPSGGNLGPGRPVPRRPTRCGPGSRRSATSSSSYCGSGVTACHNALAIRIAGPARIRSSTPARTATGPAPGGRSRRAPSRGRPSWTSRYEPGAAGPRLRSHDGGLQERRGQCCREADREVAQQRDLEPEQGDLGPEREAQPVADHVEREEGGEHGGT